MDKRQQLRVGDNLKGKRMMEIYKAHGERVKAKIETNRRFIELILALVFLGVFIAAAVVFIVSGAFVFLVAAAIIICASPLYFIGAKIWKVIFNRRGGVKRWTSK
jgi:hypothetical protein